jgi:hypothetical protein
MTKKKQSQSKPTSSSYERIDAARILSVNSDDDIENFTIEVVDNSGNASDLPCTVDIFRAVKADNITAHYRVNFILYKNKKSGVVERITSEPKTEYQAYKVEYEEEIKLPKKEVFTPPA